MACGYNIGQHIFYSTQLKFESVTLKNNRKKKKKKEKVTPLKIKRALGRNELIPYTEPTTESLISKQNQIDSKLLHHCTISFQ